MPEKKLPFTPKRELFNRYKDGKLIPKEETPKEETPKKTASKGSSKSKTSVG